MNILCLVPNTESENQFIVVITQRYLKVPNQFRLHKRRQLQSEPYSLNTGLQAPLSCRRHLHNILRNLHQSSSELFVQSFAERCWWLRCTVHKPMSTCSDTTWESCHNSIIMSSSTSKLGQSCNTINLFLHCQVYLSAELVPFSLLLSRHHPGAASPITTTMPADVINID